MGQGSWDGRRIASAWVLSLAAHAGLIGAGALLVARTLSDRDIAPARIAPSPRSADEPIEIDLPAMSDGTFASLETVAQQQPGTLARGGGDGAARPDSGTRGRGGTNAAEQPALNLADRDEGTFLSPEVRSRLDRSQIQRIDSSKRRAAREDWRASREPMELTFVANGDRGVRPDRRPPSARDPSVGARDRGAPARQGSALGAAPASIGVLAAAPLADPLALRASAQAVGSPLEGAEHASAGLGVRDGRPGPDHRDSVAVALARPMVAEGTPSVPAEVVGRPQDNLDSEQEVATALQSLVHASTAGGARGVGPGGEAGAGPTGSGGVTGPGSRSQALGSGRGGIIDNDPLDRRRSQYMRQVMTRVHPLWANAFPKWAAAEGLQGTVIVTFVILADGRVADASVTRPSGVAEFDENCRRAVLRGAPYPPVPPELGPSFRWAMPFEAKNPAVLPKRPRPDP